MRVNSNREEKYRLPYHLLLINDVYIFFLTLDLCSCAEYLDFGDIDTVCSKCGAMVWYLERAEKHIDTCTPKVSLCCMKGNVTLPYMIEPPTLIRNLFSGVDSRSSHFISNIRSYNNMFAFTSLGGRVESGENDGAGPPRFVISGQNYHRIGSLLPDEGQPPKFAQLYIYDTENEVSNRLSHFRFYYLTHFLYNYFQLRWLVSFFIVVWLWLIVFNGDGFLALVFHMSCFSCLIF